MTQATIGQTKRALSPRAPAPQGALVVALAICALSTTMGCDECRTFADCTGEGFMACVDGACQEVAIDEGESCEGPASCGEGAWACVDGRCAQTPSCQSLVADMAYAARCDGSAVPRTGTARATASGCVSTLSSSDAFPFDITLTELPIADGLVVDGVGTGGTCLLASWSALDSTLLLTGCSVGGETCDIVARSKGRDGAPCLPATVPACAAGQTCTAIATLSGAGACQ